MTINTFKGDGIFDEEYLSGMPAITETKYVRHVRLDKPVTIKVDGTKRMGVVLK